jgi:hypothetical protein
MIHINHIYIYIYIWTLIFPKFFLICNDIQYFIKQIISTSETPNLPFFKRIYKKKKVIIIKNLNFKLRSVNKIVGYIQNISIKKSQWIH